MKPLVSVIIPCYNKAQYLAQTIDSALNQTYPEIEVIVINDGSLDNTLEVLQAYSENPRVKIIDQENQGVSKARNAGIALAQGEYFQFVDADDWLHPEKTALQMEVMEARPDIGLVYCDWYVVYPDRGITEELPITRHIMPLQEELLTALWVGNVFSPLSALLRREWLIQTPGFRVGVEGCEDYEMWLRLAALGCKMYLLNRKLVYYRDFPESLSKNEERMKHAYLGARTAIAQDFPEKVAATTVEMIRFFAEYFQEKNNWEQRQDYNIVELRASINSLSESFNSLSESFNELKENHDILENAYSELDEVYHAQTRYVRKLEQDLSETKNYALTLKEKLEELESNRYIRLALKVENGIERVRRK